MRCTVVDNHRQALRAWRGFLGITQEQAARAADVALGTYRGWESGASAGGPCAAYLVRMEAKYAGLLELLGSVAEGLRNG